MVIITCKKCGKYNEMPSRRFKLCLICNKRIKKVEKKTEIISSNLFNVIPYFVIHEISYYLTISEIYNLSKISHEYENILNEVKIWKNVIKRDFWLNYEFVDDIYPNIINFAYSIDNYKICYICLLYNCEKGCINFNKKVSKTNCLKNYKLNEIELKNIDCDIRYHYIYKKYITLYNYKDILQLLSRKYLGFTNYTIYQANLEFIKEQKRLKRIENMEKKLQILENWKDSYILTFDYTYLRSDERRELLDKYLLENGMQRREDSQLCQSFIQGNIRDKSIEHIAAILKLTQILFSYSHIVYSEFHEQCKRALEIKKFEQDLKNSKRNKFPFIYTWFDALNNIHNKYRRKFERYEYNVGLHLYEDEEF